VARLLAVQNNLFTLAANILPISGTMMFVYVLQILLLATPLPKQSLAAKALGGLLGFVWGLCAAVPINLMLRAANRKMFSRWQAHQQYSMSIGPPAAPRLLAPARGRCRLQIVLKQGLLFLLATLTSSLLANYAKVNLEQLYRGFSSQEIEPWYQAVMWFVVVSVLVADVPAFMLAIPGNFRAWQQRFTSAAQPVFADEQLQALAGIYYHSALVNKQSLHFDSVATAVTDLRGKVLQASNDTATWCRQKRPVHTSTWYGFLAAAALFFVNMLPEYFSGTRVAKGLLGVEVSWLQGAFAVVAAFPLYSIEFFQGTELFSQVGCHRSKAPIRYGVGTAEALARHSIKKQPVVKAFFLAAMSSAPPLFYLLYARGREGLSGLGSTLVTLSLLSAVLYAKLISRAWPTLAKAANVGQSSPGEAYVEALVAGYEARVQRLERRGVTVGRRPSFYEPTLANLVTSLEQANEQLDSQLQPRAMSAS
jgi:hypothetical protein